MAVSSALSTDNQYIKYTIECIENNQSTNDNTSNVTVKVRFYRTNTGYETYGTGTVYCKINGTTYSASVTSSQKITNSGIILFTKTMDIGHGSDGSKTLSMSAWISHSQVSSSEQSYSQKLTDIPRTSSFTLSTSNATMGSTQITVNISRASSSFTHHVVYKVGSNSWTGTTSATTSFSFTPSINDCSQIPNSTTGTGTIIVKTYNGSTYIGEASKTLTLTVPSSVVPSFSSLSLTRVDNGVPSAWGVYVKGKSKVTYAINGATGSYGSTISSYKVTGCGGTWTSQSTTTGELWSTGTQTFTATITDSRGRTATKTNSITIYDYWSPNITSLVLYRCNSNGVSNDDGTSVTVNVGFNTASVGGHNDNNRGMRIRWKKKADNSYGSWVGIVGDQNVVINGNFSANDTYDFEINLYDYFTNISRVINLPTAKVTMDFRNGGNGIAIGKVAEKDGLEVEWDSYFNKLIVNDLQHYGCALASTSNDGAGKWYEVAQLLVTSQYGDAQMIFDMLDYGNGGAYSVTCSGVVRMKQQSAMGSPPGCSLSISNFFNMTPDDWKLVIVENSTTRTLGKLFFRNRTGYSIARVVPRIKLGNLTMVDQATGLTSLPPGLVISQTDIASNFDSINGYGIGATNGSNRNKIPTITSSGVMEVGRYIDFHYNEDDAVDYHARIDCNASGNLSTMATLNVNSFLSNEWVRAKYIGNNINNQLEFYATNYFRFLASPGTGQTETRDIYFENNSTSVAFRPKASDNGAISNGTSFAKWSAVHAVNGTIQTSDATDKTNIQYISYDESHKIDDIFFISTQEQENERQKHYDFIKGINFAKWDWVDNNIDGLDNLGFIAQDIAGTEVGDRILYVGEDGKYGYSLSNYVTTIAIALQHSIQENNELKTRLEKLEKMLGVGV